MGEDGMTWRTPCTDPDNDTELWTSDDVTDREKARDLCRACPRLLACFAEAEAMKRKGLEVSGVNGGVDFTRSKRQKQADPRVCGFCGAVVLQPTNGRRRSFCSKKHRQAAQIEKRRRRRAA
jgi:hypothetical protein